MSLKLPARGGRDIRAGGRDHHAIWRKRYSVNWALMALGNKSVYCKDQSQNSILQTQLLVVTITLPSGEKSKGFWKYPIVLPYSGKNC